MSARAYLKDPAAIYRQSFAMIEAEAKEDLLRLPEELRAIAMRMIHACGMVEIANSIAWDDGIVEAARSHVAAGAPIFCDARMVADGLIAGRFKGNDIVCPIGEEAIAQAAARQGGTRAMAAIEAWQARLPGSIVVIGNAPTALFRLIELIEEGVGAPGAIVAMPVGFVGAAESKEALIEARLGIPYLTLRGRLGGSAIAAAAMNALAGEAP